MSASAATRSPSSCSARRARTRIDQACSCRWRRCGRGPVQRRTASGEYPQRSRSEDLDGVVENVLAREQIRAQRRQPQPQPDHVPCRGAGDQDRCAGECGDCDAQHDRYGDSTTGPAVPGRLDDWLGRRDHPASLVPGGPSAVRLTANARQALDRLVVSGIALAAERGEDFTVGLLVETAAATNREVRRDAGTSGLVEATVQVPLEGAGDLDAGGATLLGDHVESEVSHSHDRNLPRSG